MSNKILLSNEESQYSISKTTTKHTTAMTSNILPSPLQASASTITSTTYDAWKAFNGTNINSSDCWLTLAANPTGQLTINYGIQRKMNYLELTSRNDATASTLSPKNFLIQGTNNGTDWATIHELKDQIGWTANQKRIFEFDSEILFSRYRINVTANNGGTQLSIGEVLFGYVERKLIEISSSTESDFISYGMNQSDLAITNLSLLFNKKETISEDGTPVIVETEPFSIHDVFGYDEEENPLPMGILYYTDDQNKTSASLEITANYSPLDDIDGNYEVVTWTDEKPAARKLSLIALPKPQFIKQIDSNDVYGTITEFLTTESFSGAGNGVIRYLLSPDKTTWKTWNGTIFTNIDVTNMSNIVSNGMKRATLQSLTSSDWSKWVGQKLYLGIYLEEGIRDKTKAHIDSISYKDSAPKESTQISDAKLYILNTVSTIDVTFAGSTITGVIDDEDEGKVQYRIKLNGNDYFPADGSFTPLMASPLNISTTLVNDDILIDENNTLRIEFKDYWGSIDYWQTNFIGAYSGLLFLDETGEYYSTDIGGILQYLDFGVIIAGQTTIEQAILLRNTYGYTVDNINIRANQAGFPNGMKAQFGTNEISFEALDVLNLEGQMEDGDERTFYIRLSTQLGVTPQATGEFDIIVTADKVEEVEV